MTPAPENPPAFPRSITEVHRDGNVLYTAAADGMSLRDYFAGQAVAGSLCEFTHIPSSERGQRQAQKIAAQSYAIADAMLAARTQPKPTP